MMRFLAVLIAFCFCLPAFGQIKAEKNYPAYSLIEFDIVASESAAWRHVIWKFEPAKISGKQMPDGQMVFTAPPGSYRVLASVMQGTKDGEKITVEQSGHQLFEHQFTIGGEGDPKPPPDDEDHTQPPPNPPQPTTVPAMVLVVEESSQRTAETAMLLADATYWSSVVDRGMRWRVYDIDSLTGSTITNQDKWAAAANAAGLPAMVILDKDGAVIASSKLPGKSPDIDAAIKKAGGK